MNRHALSRRAILRGAGVSLGLPLLDAMVTDGGLLHGTARAAAPVRLVTFFWPNGPRGSRWAPASTGAITAGSLGACMKDAFAPVPGRPDVVPFLNIVTGLGADDVWKSGHSCAMMACGHGTADDHNNYGNWPTAASIDQVCAGKLGGATRLASLALSSPSNAFNNTPGWSMISWKDGGRGVPPSKNPRDVFRLLTGGGPTGDPVLARAAARRKSLLDFIKADAQRLSMRLGPADRARVDEHLASVRELERQLTAPAAAGADCGQPAEPTGASDVVMLKLLVLAFKCDQTRYASFMLDVGSGQRSYPGQGGGDHDLSHNADDNTIIRRTNIKLQYLADLLRDMAASPEAGATMLDNALVYSVSDVVDGKTHGREPRAGNAGLPVLVAGRAGGSLKSGRHLAYDRKRLSDLLCSLLNYAGVPTARYGSNGTGPLPGL